MAEADVIGLSYEAALAELDQLIAQLETGRVDLEQALTCYERGTTLARHCQDLLDRTEAKISKVVIGGGGRVEERPFPMDGAINSPGTEDSRNQSVEPVPLRSAKPGQPPHLRARSAPVLFPGYQPPQDSSTAGPPVDPDDIPF